MRAEYPALAGRAFLNTATFGQLSRRTIAAMQAHLAHRDATACMDFLNWFEDHDRLRGKLARLINASPEDIAFAPNASTALGLLLSGLPWQPGDEFLTLEGEFPNNLYAAAYLEARGVHGRTLRWERLGAVLGERTRVVALSTANYATGLRPDVTELSRECRRRGILLYLDATQTLGAYEFDFQKLQPALVAVNAYKWMLAPNGAAFFAIREDVRREIAPLAVGWRSDRDWRNVAHLHHGAPRFADTAEKYEAGMLASLVLYGLEASVDLMLELGPQAIEQRVRTLALRARSLLEDCGATLLHPDTAILAAKFPGADPVRLVEGLKEENVLVSARHGCLRVSTHFYNNEEDLERLRVALGRLRRRDLPF